MDTRSTCRGHKPDGSRCRYYARANGYCDAHQEQAQEHSGSETPAKRTREWLEAAIAEHGGTEGLDLTNADLSGLDLTGMDLRGVVLSRWEEDNTVVMANLQGTLMSCIDLRGAILEGADLPGAILEGANLQGADLLHADLQGAHLADASLQGATLQQADLQRAGLIGASLEGADLVLAVLRKAALYGTNLQGADLSSADLQGAILAKANLREADLRLADCSYVDLLDVAEGGLRGVRLHRANLNRTLVKREQLEPAIGEELVGEYREARETYLALKCNFEDLGDYEAASWAYIKERKMERACSAPWRARSIYGREQLGDVSKDEERGIEERHLPIYHPRVLWFYLRHTLKWAGDWLVWLVCDYGEGPWRTLTAMGIVYLLFAAIYWLTWAVVRETPRPSGIVDLVPTRNPVDVLVFSAGAFTTMDPSDVGPLALWVQLVATVEALVGISLTGLLGFVLGNRIRRS